MFGHATYLVLELGWALPVILLQIALGWRELWAHRTAWFGATAASTVYLCLADRLAIGDGIWHIAPDRSTGILIGGLPLEEAVFFLLTNLLVVQAMLLFMAPSMRARAASWLRHIATASGLGTGAGELVRAGYRRGLLGAVGGALLTSMAGAILQAPTALEPVAQAVMQWTPVSVANVLLQLLGPSASPLALLGALALFMAAGGLLGAVDGAGRGSAVRGATVGLRGLAWFGLAVIAWWSAGESDVRTAIAQVAGMGAAMVYDGVWFGSTSPAESPSIPGSTGLTPPAPLPYVVWEEAAPTHPAPPPPLPGERGYGSPLPRRESLAHTAAILGGASGVVGIAFADMALRDRAAAATAGVPFVPYAVPGPRVPGFPAVGQLPEVTPVPQFYVVSKNAQDPRADPLTWRLRIGGLVGRPLVLTFDDLRQLPRRDEHVTFQCVSNPVGGSLMGAAWWSGASLADLVERASPLASAGKVVLRAPDGHEESVPLEIARRPDALVAYAMNGEYLTRLHGHPARALLPGHYGFKQVKWLTHIELATPDHRGYWPRRGWTDVAAIRTTARIDVVRPEADGLHVAGVALAGRRGIRAVEVRAGSAPWVSAQLHIPALSPSMWVQWRALLPGVPVRPELSVEARATEADGTPQELADSPPFPNGSSGYHRVAAVPWSRSAQA